MKRGEHSPSSTGRRTGGHTARCNVAVIDDDELARQMIADLLVANGVRVTQIDSPIGASREIVALDAHVVVLDLSMPSMSGDRLASLLRRNPRLMNIGIVFVTSDASAMPGSLPPELADASLVLKEDLEDKLPSAVRRACRLGCGAR